MLLPVSLNYKRQIKKGSINRSLYPGDMTQVTNWRPLKITYGSDPDYTIPLFLLVTKNRIPYCNEDPLFSI